MALSFFQRPAFLFRLRENGKKTPWGSRRPLLYQQDDLASLCAERPLEWGEYAPMNEFHGNASVLKRYMGLPEGRPLAFAIEHAIPYDLEKAYDYDAHCGLPLFLAVNETSLALYRKSGLNARAAGFTYLYALELFKREHRAFPRGERRGTLVFPDKSTLLMNTDFDRAAFARRLRELPEAFQPVVVCIYWKDYVRGTHVPFEEAGLPLVSCGHLQDPLFPFRLHDLCRRFRYACANDIAGSFVLSILSGCHFFHLPGGPIVMVKNGERREHLQDPGFSKPDKAACLAAAPYPPSDPAPQRLLAERLAGVSNLRSPQVLRDWHAEAEQALADRLGPGGYEFGPGMPPGRLAAFRPVGVDLDGWCRKTSSFRVPASARAGAVHLEFGIPRTLSCPHQVLRIHRNGAFWREETVADPVARLEIPLDASGGESLVEFQAQQDYPLLNEPRRRAWNIRKIELVPR